MIPKLKPKSKKEAPIRPVLMVPLRRCGSHALRLRLNLNPDFYSPYPLHIVDFMPLVPLYGDLQNDDAYFQLCVDLIGLLAVSPVKWPGVFIEPIPFFEKIKDLPRSAHTIAWELLFAGARAHDARVVMDKSLDNVHAWQEIGKLYPDALFLNVVRDPRAQINSMNRAIIHDFDTLLNTQTWVQAHEQIQKLTQSYPDRVSTIRFEDFITEEEITLRKVCDFIGLDFSPEMLEISKSEEAKRISHQSALWESNSSRPIQAHIDKFKSSLAESEILLIESLTEKFMDLYGYTRMTQGSLTITSEMKDQARLHSEAGRKKAWEDLKKAKPKDYILRKHRANYIEMCRKRLTAEKMSSTERPLA